MQPGDWPVPVKSVAGASAATVAWLRRGRWHVTVIVKATFAFAGGGEMAPVAPEPIARDEQEYGAGLRTAGDLAPYLEQADVLLTGHVRVASRGPGAEPAGLRFIVRRGEVVLLDKAAALDAPRDAPARVRVPGMGPLSRSWPARRRLLGDLDPRLLQGTTIELPDGVDAAYFQAAPADQRVELLQGGEWIAVEGAGTDPSLIEARLPALRGVAWLHGQTEALRAGVPLRLTADTLHIDLIQRVCNVTWRGWAPVPDGEHLSSLWALAAFDLVSLAAPPPVVAPRTLAADTFDGTVALTAEAVAALSSVAAVPFSASPRSAPPRPSVAGRPPDPGPPASPGGSRERTMDLDREDVARLAVRPATPFGEGPPADAAPPERTVELGPSVHAEMVRAPVLPFDPDAPPTLDPSPTVARTPTRGEEIDGDGSVTLRLDAPPADAIDPEDLGANFLAAMGPG